MYFVSDAAVVDSTLDYGFRVSGVRYGFDSDKFGAFYESPHPYDGIVPPSGGGNYNVQVIYSPYQQPPASPLPTVPQMRLQLDPRFELDPNDRLYLFNSSDPAGPPVEVYSDASPPPADGWVTPIMRIDPDLPIGYVIVLYRAPIADVNPDWGYKVSAMEYTDQFTQAGDPWIFVSEPIIETPHNLYLGRNETPVSYPGVLPVMNNYVGYQTIYRPFCPNVDVNSGVGTVDNWQVQFSDGCDLTASTAGVNDDYIRITTPGNPIALNGADTIYFINPNSRSRWRIRR